jgi:hypothetical protein
MNNNKKNTMYAGTGRWIDGHHLESEKVVYDTKDYSISDDDEIIDFVVFDNNFIIDYC